MATKKQSSHLRSSAQNANISLTKSPSKPVQSKILKLKDTMESEDEKESGVKEMFETIMGKLSKLDEIDSCVKSMENDLKDMISSLEFVHAEVKISRKKMKNARQKAIKWMKDQENWKI